MEVLTEESHLSPFACLISFSYESSAKYLAMTPKNKVILRPPSNTTWSTQMEVTWCQKQTQSFPGCLATPVGFPPPWGRAQPHWLRQSLLSSKGIYEGPTYVGLWTNSERADMACGEQLGNFYILVTPRNPISVGLCEEKQDKWDPCELCLRRHLKGSAELGCQGLWEESHR